MNNKIGKFIAQKRKSMGLTQKELGDKLYVTDKAVSKWERGISLPDVSLLIKLADILKIDVQDILEGQKSTRKDDDIDKRVAVIKEELARKHKRKIRIFTACILFLFFFTSLIILRNITFGYKIERVQYAHSGKKINLGINKTSFLLKNNDRSYSYKNLRNPNILENEIKQYLKTLNFSSCNDTIYYYDDEEDFSIIDYKVRHHFLYSTISYEIVDGDYCETIKQEEYANKLGGLNRYHVLSGASIDMNKDWSTHLEVAFIDKDKFKAEMRILYYMRRDKYTFQIKTLEESEGVYEIIDDKLYYRRTSILRNDGELTIPEVSVFKISNSNLILLENYIFDYEKNVILKLAQ